MTRIAIISSIAYSLANFRGPLIADMIACGGRVYALAPDYDEETRARVRALGAEPIDISLERTGMKPVRDIADMIRLAAVLRRLRIELAFNYFAKPVIFGTLAAAIAGVPRRHALIAGLGYVFTPDGAPPPLRRRILQHVVSQLYRIALRFAHRVFFQNQDDLDQFVDAGLIDRGRGVRLNGTGVDIEKLFPSAPPAAPITFLLMARLLREKGIAEFVEAARILKRDFPDARFVLLGGPDPNPGGLTIAQVAAWRDEGVIEWPGHVDDVLPWIRNSSVYVLPSWREGVPRSTQEAMAIGRAVVTTDTVGCRETVIPSVNGFLVPLRDPPELAAAMRRFLDDPALITSMGLASRSLAESRFDVREINRRMLAEMNICPLDGPSEEVGQKPQPISPMERPPSDPLGTMKR